MLGKKTTPKDVKAVARHILALMNNPATPVDILNSLTSELDVYSTNLDYTSAKQVEAVLEAYLNAKKNEAMGVQQIVEDPEDITDFFVDNTKTIG